MNISDSSNKALKLLQNSKKILVHLHVKPDLDSIGSALGVHYALTSIGKDVTVIKGDSEVPRSFSALPGYTSIVHKNYFEINLSEFDIFIILDSSSLQQISTQKEIVFPEHLKTIVIDHHVTNQIVGTVRLVDASYAATAELLYDIFTEWGINLDKNSAACLYAGIYGDTGGFTYLSTTARTLAIAAKLGELFPDFTKLIYNLTFNQSKEKIYLDAIALKSIKTYFNDTVAISTLSYRTIAKLAITPEDLDSNSIATTLITVKNWQIGITIIEKRPGTIAVSFRSKGKYDISKAALLLGGGGHKRAAGVRLQMSLKRAEKKVLETLAVLNF